MDDDALEELSVAREPRSRDTNSMSRSIVDQLPKFSEWAAGRQSSLDADTVSKHVRQMVDVSCGVSITTYLLVKRESAVHLHVWCFGADKASVDYN